MSKKAVLSTALASTLTAAIAFGFIKYRRKSKSQQTAGDDPPSRWVSS